MGTGARTHASVVQKNVVLRQHVSICILFFWYMWHYRLYNRVEFTTRRLRRHIWRMFGPSLPSVNVVCRSIHVLFMLFVFVCVWWCLTHIVLCFCFVYLLLVSCVWWCPAHTIGTTVDAGLLSHYVHLCDIFFRIQDTRYTFLFKVGV